MNLRFTIGSLIALFLLGIAPSNSVGQELSPPEVLKYDLTMVENKELDIKQFQWINRVIIVFSDSPFNLNYIEQLELLEEDQAALQDRDIVILIDSDPIADSLIRQSYHPRGFDMLVVGKDGRTFLRKPNPWTIREISRAIDKLPMRQQEIKLKGR